MIWAHSEDAGNQNRALERIGKERSMRRPKQD